MGTGSPRVKSCFYKNERLSKKGGGIWEKREETKTKPPLQPGGYGENATNGKID